MSSRPTPVKLYIWSRGLGAAYFWGAISIPYLVYRGFSISQAFSLIGLYSLLVVILEFPTGVIGDLYGHKLSVNLANALGAINMLILAQDLPKIGYYLLIISLATAASLISGSDDALLKKISPNFSRDLATTRSIQAFVAFLTVSLGGYIANLNFSIPLYLTSFVWLIATILTSQIDVSHTKSKGANIFSLAFASTKHVVASLTLLGIILYAGINGAFAMNIKTLINSFGAGNQLNLTYISMLVGLGFLFRTIAFQLSPRLSWFSNRALFLTVATLFVLIALLQPGYLSLSILGVLNGFTALISLRASLLVNSLVGDSIRASVLSLKNLIARLFSSGYLFIAGAIIEGGNFRILMLATLILYSLAGVTFVKLKSNGQQVSATTHR